MRKRLSKSDLAKIAEMLASGKSTSEVANYLNVSQATIYNQKSKLIREGLKLPEVKRGRKPIKPTSIDSKSASQQVIRPTKSFDEYRFLINNVSVRISGKAKDVYVSKNEMRIIF
jgi:transposase-like protein